MDGLIEILLYTALAINLLALFMSITKTSFHWPFMNGDITPNVMTREYLRFAKERMELINKAGWMV